jgi:hypothetical protein
MYGYEPPVNYTSEPNKQIYQKFSVTLCICLFLCSSVFDGNLYFYPLPKIVLKIYLYLNLRQLYVTEVQHSEKTDADSE